MARLLLALLFGLLLPACNLALPFSRAGDDGAGHRELGSVEARGADGPPDGAVDRSRRDGLRVKDVSAEMHTADLAPSCVAGGCVECEPVTSALCPKGDLGPVCGGSDCDSLPDWRDPWTVGAGKCNPLLYQETFKSGLAGWNTSGYGVSVSTCGLLTLQHGQGWVIGVALQSTPAAALTTPYLTEVRLVPPSGSGGVFWLASETDLSASQPYPGRVCKLEFLAGNKVKLTAKFIHPTSGEMQSSGAPVPYATSSAGLILQSWAAGSLHHCRLWQNGVQVDHVLCTVLASLSPGTIEVTMKDAYGPHHVDYVRAFGHP